MKRLLLIILILGGGSISVAAQALVPRICPTPTQMEVSSTEYFPVETLTVECPDSQAATWAAAHLDEWFLGKGPKIVSRKGGKGMPEGSYELSVSAKGVRVTAGGLQGVRYALYSLRQIAMPARGTKTVGGWIAPRAEVSDGSAAAFRGIHICWFHETDPLEVERLVRLAAYYKLNYAVIEPWGSFRSDVAPWYGWPDGTMTKEAVAHLKAVADDLGITLIPQLNVFGHATMARDGAGKHAGLDIAPEYQPLFEPAAGWNWCLSNPETRKLIIDLIGELHETFGRPPYFHIGCDEADPPSCPDCLAVPYSKLFLDHLNAVNDAVTALGARPMMWHDMLLQRGDPRWKDFYANGSPETAAATVDLPRDIIICDWFYEGAKNEYPTLDYFKGLGFDVLTCPWLNVSGINALGAAAASKGLYGVLGTLWHHYFGEDLLRVYTNLANACWSGDPAAANYGSRHYFLTHLRQMGWDMKLTDPRHTGLYFDELPVEPILNN